MSLLKTLPQPNNEQLETLRRLNKLTQQSAWHLPKRPSQYLAYGSGAKPPPEGFDTWEQFALHLNDAIQGGRTDG